MSVVFEAVAEAGVQHNFAQCSFPDHVRPHDVCAAAVATCQNVIRMMKIVAVNSMLQHHKVNNGGFYFIIPAYITTLHIPKDNIVLRYLSLIETCWAAAQTLKSHYTKYWKASKRCTCRYVKRAADINRWQQSTEHTETEDSTQICDTAGMKTTCADDSVIVNR